MRVPGQGMRAVVGEQRESLYSQSISTMLCVTALVEYGALCHEQCILRRGRI